MDSLQEELRKIILVHDQREKIQLYKDVVTKIIVPEANLSITALNNVVEFMLHEDVPLVVSRGILNHLAESLAKLDSEKFTWRKDFIIGALEKIRSRIVSFEEPDALLRESLAEEYTEEEEYISAADVLAVINLESGSRQYSDPDKVAKYVRIAELYLQEDDTVRAENFVNRASRFIHTVTEWSLKLRYQVCYARILDAKRKFLEAAVRYHDLSQSHTEEVDQEDLLELLSKAVSCGILAGAGPKRSRLLGALYKDERVRNSAHAQILEKMYMERLLKKSEVVKFEESLMPHQKATLGNGLSVLQQAMLEHNVLATSKVYNNIRLSELGVLLEIDADEAEKVAAQMISEGRLEGSIDQVEQILEFNAGCGALQTWDNRINAICFDVNAAVESISNKIRIP